MTVPEFQSQKGKKKLVVVTAYDALFTRIIEQAGIDVILVGDSLGVVVQGKPDTLSVTMDDMVYHTRLVAQSRRQALVIADMPFMSYQASEEEAIHNAGRLIQAGAAAVKVEGGGAMVDRVRALTTVGIPVMGHLGMTPQSVNRFGGYKVQGREATQADALLNDAKALEAAGAFALVLEAMPATLAQSMTQAVSIPTIGIGAGPHCDGQVLVLYDLLGLFDEFVPKFVKPYAHLKADALQALRRFKEEVECQKFPTDQESYQ
ncbi:MAG: 3-methyl-2-oxobutanoate hydroxymethyltransferase [Nitrospira sp. SB0677_bin_15]|nr:3-methyl-2-oxobutanoate hydroxymethyltransferase [Nitrospira sp. SB0667_bin_9]MYD30607.1 3-methyl-2-oxobutanoate hydroxymethyltransferase [Nitrospira sp. SB0661_bin_20]MYG40846.1 3-methyl-2-oxobutanoate hydroxymethyltransferase [Nitrospira sp. SB0677_bin_15]MYH02417.1 3-methyl-2-oxobutanoate hydroxymethyltransferase [Nitrospira sp. SB0675_bin_23]MYJ23648.1 3-methyl-2-oxobutanoate hydroxymethyltransferase [Nitrospira sp. SB0673_bin_12]